MPTHVVTDVAGTWPADPTKLAYDGPFKVDAYTEGQKLDLSRNEHFAGAHLAYLDKITLRFIDNLDTAANAFQTGEVTVAPANPASLDALKAQFGSQLVMSVGATDTQGLAFNLTATPLNNPQLRLAISQAINRDTLVNVTLKGAAAATTSWIPEELVGLDKNAYNAQIGYNAEQAKANFAAAGGQPGMKLTMPITSSQKPRADVIASMLKDTLGIDVTEELVDGPTMSKRFAAKDFQILLFGWAQDYPDPESWVSGLFESNGANNNFGCANPQIDALFQKTTSNLDAASRKSQFLDINRLISAETCGIAPLYHKKTFTLVSSKLKGAAETAGPQDRFVAGDWDVEEWYLGS
jgi:ABC-type oligopeptide transport system substrate-binding subunit